jgi:hypothetical protein
MLFTQIITHCRTSLTPSTRGRAAWATRCGLRTRTHLRRRPAGDREPRDKEHSATPHVTSAASATGGNAGGETEPKGASRRR